MEADGTIRTARLLLEPLTHAHAGELFGALCDPRLYEFIPREPPRSVEELEERLRRVEVRCAAASCGSTGRCARASPARPGPSAGWASAWA